MREALDTFFSAWGETDADRRRELISGVLAPAFSYCDPRTPGRITTADALLDYVGAFSANAPGWTASVVRADGHHGYTRALVAFGDGEMAQHGTYFGEADESGNIVLLTGFVGTGVAE
ncbi:hypothetical protein OG2516_07987 [Oceanicola granulosus HTCC2516]|uniref:SnoaL-like domain-containing protein n=1 Tax=Oceanicola granulosus (strain ATCC BAA-861 / DSM 15982 / KCTC 12143 / HTCC2516) TaxID=314256 RepID=Q2CI57_OCEGH|nr:hypothetical protein [Oceanicola granulosus]EAR52401.1 hypothetical protein OG2516_07987 [Oceanicola granulosus HTCC2516]